jgi:hypothetical protein
MIKGLLRWWRRGLLLSWLERAPCHIHQLLLLRDALKGLLIWDLKAEVSCLFHGQVGDTLRTQHEIVLYSDQFNS